MSARSAFGRDRGGTPARAQELGAERGFAVRLVEPVEVGGQRRLLDPHPRRYRGRETWKRRRSSA